VIILTNQEMSSRILKREETARGTRRKDRLVLYSLCERGDVGRPAFRRTWENM